MDHPRLTRNKESRWVTITARQREYAASPPGLTQPLLRGTRESVTRHVTRDTCQQLGAPRDTVFRAVMGGGDSGYGRIFVELYGCTPVTLHSEGIWGFIKTKVFFDILEHNDENKS